MSSAEFERYDALEKTYWWFRVRRDILSVFLDMIPSPERKTVLEIGCGTGGNLRYLFSEFHAKMGIEYDSDAIGYAKRKLTETTTLIQGDANHLCLRPASVDCIAMLDVLYHKRIPDVEHVLRQAHSALIPDGYLLITDGAFRALQGKHNDAVQSARRFTRKELITALRQADYDMIRASYWGVVLFFLLFLKRSILERILPSSDKSANFDLVELPIIDHALYYCVRSERHVLRHCSLPLGASVVILAQKRSHAL